MTSNNVQKVIEQPSYRLAVIQPKSVNNYPLATALNEKIITYYHDKRHIYISCFPFVAGQLTSGNFIPQGELLSTLPLSQLTSITTNFKLPESEVHKSIMNYYKSVIAKITSSSIDIENMLLNAGENHIMNVNTLNITDKTAIRILVLEKVED